MPLCTALRDCSWATAEASYRATDRRRAKLSREQWECTSCKASPPTTQGDMVQQLGGCVFAASMGGWSNLKRTVISVSKRSSADWEVIGGHRTVTTVPRVRPSSGENARFQAWEYELLLAEGPETSRLTGRLQERRCRLSRWAVPGCRKIHTAVSDEKGVAASVLGKRCSRGCLITGGECTSTAACITPSTSFYHLDFTVNSYPIRLSTRRAAPPHLTLKLLPGNRTATRTITDNLRDAIGQKPHCNITQIPCIVARPSKESTLMDLERNHKMKVEISSRAANVVAVSSLRRVGRKMVQLTLRVFVVIFSHPLQEEQLEPIHTLSFVICRSVIQGISPHGSATQSRERYGDLEYFALIV